MIVKLGLSSPNRDEKKNIFETTTQVTSHMKATLLFKHAGRCAVEKLLSNPHGLSELQKNTDENPGDHPISFEDESGQIIIFHKPRFP